MGRRRIIAEAALFALLSASVACGPSKAQMAERAEEARRIMRAHAVHMPPKGTDPCVGVTLRLTEQNEGTARERAEFAKLITKEEVALAVTAAGIETCKEIYLDGIKEGGLVAEPLHLQVGYGIDPDGKTCAVVEREKPEPIDPGAAPLIEAAGECLKNVLFKARFPAGRVKDLERVIFLFDLTANPTQTITSTKS